MISSCKIEERNFGLKYLLVVCPGSTLQKRNLLGFSAENIYLFWTFVPNLLRISSFMLVVCENIKLKLQSHNGVNTVSAFAKSVQKRGHATLFFPVSFP